jgi:hypothetical protein
MTNLVHYMVRNPARLGELIYPLELNEPDYQAYGSFFIDGSDIDDLRDSYLFYGLSDEVFLPIDLRRVGKAQFDASVPKIGRFRFTATKVGVPAKYGGTLPFPSESLLVRQLAPYDRTALERAALEFNFYFIGFSPVIDGTADVKLQPAGRPSTDSQKRQVDW